MISEKNINQSWNSIRLDELLSLSPFLPQNLNENCSDFSLPLDTVGFSQFAD